ncbi:MAG: HD domain-containing protein, partial [Candidatus Eisenbacteria bacterium]|nr:HD domain-containing protein [Candidatus Eisenbacteria bacterium]
VLNVTDPLQERAFGTEDCGLLLELAARVSRAWQKADRVDRGREVVEDATDALRRVLQHLRDGRVAAPHRVRLASGLARAMGMNDEALRTVSFAAAVHDVGMTFVTGELRARRGPLSDDQQAQMRRHVELGAELLDGLDAMTEVREIVMSHHEWWDGSGYPRGLRGTDIPVGARVLAVIDAFESMTQGRAHRAAISRQSALNELVRAAGRQFDPEVVECFERNLSRLLAGDDDPGRPHAAPETTNAGR